MFCRKYVFVYFVPPQSRLYRDVPYFQQKNQKIMSDKKLGLKDTLRLAPKIALPKKEPNLEATDRMVQKLHAEEIVEPVVVAVVPQPIIEEVQPVNESRRITLDVPLDLYKQMKRRVFDDGVTLKKYILELVNHDLNP